jgi:adenylate kinase family enzyme
MQRILIIGSSGAGKSTLSQALGRATGIPVVHLDREFWQPGWRETPREIWSERVAQLLRSERWIMDGNYGGTMPARIQAADTVVLLNLSRWL